MSDTEREALVSVMKDQIESWEFEDTREDWWKWQHQYARAADQIEADGQLLVILDAHSKIIRERIAELEAENERLRGLIKPQWFYPGDDCSSDNCHFSVDEVIESELCGWGPPKTGKHVVHISTALSGPDIWAAVHVFTDEEKDERGDDETWEVTEFATEAEARAALGDKG